AIEIGLCLLRSHDFLERVSPLPSPVDRRQIHFADVWWYPRCMDDLHAVFPDSAAFRIQLLAFCEQPLAGEYASKGAWGFASAVLGCLGPLVTPMGIVIDARRCLASWSCGQSGVEDT